MKFAAQPLPREEVLSRLRSLSGWYLFKYDPFVPVGCTRFIIMKVRNGKYKVRAVYYYYSEPPRVVNKHITDEYYKGVKALSPAIELVQYYRTQTELWQDFMEEFFHLML